MGTHTRLRLPRSPFFDAVRKSGLLTPDDLVAFVTQHDLDEQLLNDPIKLATLLVRKKLLTKYQAMQLLKGKTQGFVLGHYKILEGIRQDRVGMVFQGQDCHSKRIVAVKVLPSDRTNDPTILNAFLAEVRLAAQVDHPNVARVLDLGCHQKHVHFVVTEHVAAPTLDKVVAQTGPLPPDLVAQYAAQVAVALRHAHKLGLYHRDIKPANLAVADGRVKLIDLGLTHMLENPWKQVTKRIKTQEYADEIDHVAPEQAWGNEPDARSDIYSLGSTMYWLMTGQSPFPGTAAEKMADRQVRDVPDPRKLNPAVSAELAAIVGRMGARDPYSRYADMTELVIALQNWLPVSEWVSIAATLPVKAHELPKRQIDEQPAKSTGWFGRLFQKK